MNPLACSQYERDFEDVEVMVKFENDEAADRIKLPLISADTAAEAPNAAHGRTSARSLSRRTCRK